MLPGDRLSAATSRLQLVAAAILFSTGGTAIKATALDAWEIASYRSGIAAVTLLVLIPAARRRWNGRVLLVGTAYALAMVFFVLANRLTTAANAGFLQAAAPIYILLLGPVILREPIRRQHLLFMALVGMAVTLLFTGTQAPVATAPHPRVGNLLGGLSGFCWALTIVGLRWVATAEEGLQLPTVVAGNVIAFVVCLLVAIPVNQVTALDVSLVVYLGVVQIGLAYWFLTNAIGSVPAFDAAMLLLVEPALTPVWAWLVHAEVPSKTAILGGTLILLATLAKIRSDTRSASAGARLASSP